MRRKLSVVAALIGGLIFVAPVLAQAPAVAQPDILFTASAEAMAALARAKADRREGQNMGPAVPLLRGPGLRAAVEFRIAPTPASIHDNQGEFFYVLDGAGTLTLGGALVAPSRVNANQSGAGILGGETRPLAKGDFVYVPPGLAHYFASIGPQGLGVVTLKVPAPAP